MRLEPKRADGQEERRPAPGGGECVLADERERSFFARRLLKSEGEVEFRMMSARRRAQKRRIGRLRENRAAILGTWRVDPMVAVPRAAIDGLDLGYGSRGCRVGCAHGHGGREHGNAQHFP